MKKQSTKQKQKVRKKIKFTIIMQNILDFSLQFNNLFVPLHHQTIINIK